MTITEELEAMIDKHGLLHIVTGLSLICDEKAIHIQTNWQDKSLAKEWGKAATLLDKTARGLPKSCDP